LWVYLAILGFLTFYTHDISIADDMGWYMDSGLNIFLGKGYTDIDGSLIFDRGPVFPTLIAVCFWILGPSPWSAFWPVRIFCILNPVMVFLLGEKLFGKRVGFAAALLILTSYSMDFWSYRHLDAVWPFFVLLGNYFTILGFEKKELPFFIISGACLGIAILTKEVAILFVPFPLSIFLLVPEYRQRNLFLFTIVNISVAIIAIVPWLVYLFQNDGLDSFIGLTGPMVANDITYFPVEGSRSILAILASCWHKASDFALGIWHFYYVGRNAISANFILAPGFVAAWVFALIMAIRRNRYGIILSLNLLLFLPIIFYAGKNDIRLGQGLFILLLSYLALSWLVSVGVGAILKPMTGSATVRAVIFSVVISGLIAVQVFGESKKDLGYRRFLDRSTVINLLKEEKVGTRVGSAFGDEGLEKVVKQIMDVASENDALMVDWYPFARATYFKMSGKHPVSQMPMLWCFEEKVLFGRRPVDKEERPLWIYSNGVPIDKQYAIFMLFESHLMDVIQGHEIKYVLLTPRLWELRAYFSKSPCFEEIPLNGNIGKTYRCYKVVKGEKSNNSFGPVYTRQFLKDMAKLRVSDQKKYEYFKDRYIYGVASIDPSEFERVELQFVRKFSNPLRSE
jgi:4-amino-4-deoxy-L-arabinose transferase-like glycosyltransferase